MKNSLMIIFILCVNIVVAQTKTYSVRIISNSNNSGYTDTSKIASVDDNLKMSFVVIIKANGTTEYYSDIATFILGKESVTTNGNIKSISDNVQISWFKIEEANGDYYDNTSPTWHWEEIPYIETQITKWDNKSIISPNVIPSIYTPVYCNGKVTGTMRFKVSASIDDKIYSTKGKDSKYKGSISDEIHRISLKGNTKNEVINFAFAMCNLPYIWGSANFSKSAKWDNQAERFIGADCADFAVAAHQLAGNQIAYDRIKGLKNSTIITTPKYISKKGTYLNKQKQSIKVGEDGVKIGDFVYWKYNQQGSGHVGLFLEDKSNPQGKFKGNANGLFDEWDLVIHTLFHEPEIKSIGTAYSGALRIYRFKSK